MVSELHLRWRRQQRGFSRALAPVKEASRGDEAWPARRHGPTASHERRHAAQCAQAWIVDTKPIDERGRSSNRAHHHFLDGQWLPGRENRQLGLIGSKLRTSIVGIGDLIRCIAAEREEITRVATRLVVTIHSLGHTK